ncbi:MAG: hypothetical protein Q8P07_05930 [bacterium]|nr:hypothetical protein [bacterium]
MPEKPPENNIESGQENYYMVIDVEGQPRRIYGPGTFDETKERIRKAVEEAKGNAVGVATNPISEEDLEKWEAVKDVEHYG